MQGRIHNFFMRKAGYFSPHEFLYFLLHKYRMTKNILGEEGGEIPLHASSMYYILHRMFKNLMLIFNMPPTDQLLIDRICKM